MESLLEVMQIYNPWATHQFVKEALFFYFQRIIFLKKTQEEKGARLIEYIFGPEDSTIIQTP